MSISSEITRISNAKTAISESIANKGVTVPSGTKIDGMATLIDSIQTGGAAVQPSKALTVTSNGTTTITPDAPYDAIKQVDLTVNVASGGGGGVGCKGTLPATATNWQPGSSTTSAFLWVSDGTLISMGGHNYPNVAGKTFDGVIGLYVRNSYANYVPRITLMGSVIVNGISRAFGITTNGVTPARFAMPNELIFLFRSDSTISAIEIYNTD